MHFFCTYTGGVQLASAGLWPHQTLWKAEGIWTCRCVLQQTYVAGVYMFIVVSTTYAAMAVP